MKITKEWLDGKKACRKGLDWVIENKLIGLEGIKFVEQLIKSNKLEWANWLIVRIMDSKQQCNYAIYMAEQGIDLYEKQFPNDKRPRRVIKTVKTYLKEPTKENKNAGYAAVNKNNTAAYKVMAYKTVYTIYETANKAVSVAKQLKILNYGIKLLK